MTVRVAVIFGDTEYFSNCGIVAGQYSKPVAGKRAKHICSMLRFWIKNIGSKDIQCIADLHPQPTRRLTVKKPVFAACYLKMHNIVGSPAITIHGSISGKPQIPSAVFKKRADDLAARHGIRLGCRGPINNHFLAIETVESVVGAYPDEPLFVFVDECVNGLGQTIGGGQVVKKQPLCLSRSF